MQRCDYTPEYKPGRELVLPDMLPRAPLPETTDNKMEEEIALHAQQIRGCKLTPREIYINTELVLS